MSFVVAALYKFVDLPDFRDLQKPIEDACAAHNIDGTLLLAAEGLNGTICGGRENVDQILAYLRSLPPFSDLEHKESLAENRPFLRMRVRLKKEIVRLGMPEVRPHDRVGTYVSPEEWNDLIQDPDVTLIDTRNDYECRLGTFTGAINPKTDSFTQFPSFVEEELDPKVNKKVAMFCTGGIRCEKATSYLLDQGFEEVFHLKGGILKYLENIPETKSLYEGECFVFDQRVAVTHGLSVGTYELCYACQQPLSTEDKERPEYEYGIRCHYCHESLTPKREAALRERLKQMHLSGVRDEAHMGRQSVCAKEHERKRRSGRDT